MSTRRRIPDFTAEDVTIKFPNFGGRKDQFNAEGDRNFSILLDEATAKMLTEDGWNVKYLKPYDEDEEPQPYLKIKVSYKYKERAPRVILLNSRGRRTPLDESMVSMIDFLELKEVDVTVNPSIYEFNGNSGISAYLKTMYFKIVEDPLDLKYADYEPEPLAIESGDDDIIDGEVIEMRELEG